MCQKSNYCKLLGEDPSKWSVNAPLPPPEEFKRVFEIVTMTQAMIEAKDFIKARVLLQNELENSCRNWFIEHAQMSGTLRSKILGIFKNEKFGGALDPNKSFSDLEESIYKRDGYTCRYCGLRLMSNRELSKIERAVGKDFFQTRGNNQTRHGFIFVLRATVDHVLPHNRGGSTSLNNLVTSCWSCNYGKGKFTLEEIGLASPFGI